MCIGPDVVEKARGTAKAGVGTGTTWAAGPIRMGGGASDEGVIGLASLIGDLRGGEYGVQCRAFGCIG